MENLRIDKMKLHINNTEKNLVDSRPTKNQDESRKREAKEILNLISDAVSPSLRGTQITARIVSSVKHKCGLNVVVVNSRVCNRSLLIQIFDIPS